MLNSPRFKDASVDCQAPFLLLNRSVETILKPIHPLCRYYAVLKGMQMASDSSRSP